MGNASAKRERATLLLDQIDSAYNFARWALGHPKLAERVIENVISADVRARAPPAGNGTNTRTWLLREIRLAALRQPGYEVAPTFTDLVIPPEASGIGARAAGRTLEQSAVEHLRRAVADLSLEQREVVLLRDTEGLTYREIAALTALPQSTVVSRLWRARDVLESFLYRAGPVTAQHHQAPGLIDAYIDAEVDISAAATFVQHIAGCPDCAHRLLSRSRLVQQIRDVTRCRAPENLRMRIQRRLSREIGGAQSRSSGRA